MKKRAWRLVRAVLIAYVCAFGLLGCLQRQFTYFPARGTEPEMIARGRSTRLEPWRDAGGQLIGWRGESRERPARMRFLLFHGNAGSATDREPLADALHFAIPSDVFVLEYPGYGSRGGKPGQENFLKAGEAALAQLRGEGDLPVVLVGESIGSGVAAGIAHRHPDEVAGLILLTPFNNLADVATHHYPVFPVRLILLDRFPSDEWLRDYHGPVAVVLAGRDEIIPTRFGRELYDGYTGPKRLWIQPEATHNTMEYIPGAPWWREVVEFLDNKMARTPASPSL